MTGTMTRTIYGLCDPREASLKVRYVGCTAQKPSNRLQAHIREAVLLEDEGTEKTAWVRSLVAENLVPVLVILETLPASDQWEEREQFWIQKFEGLLNSSPGGRGHRGGMSEEVKVKISKTLTGRKRAEEATQKQRATVAANPYRHGEEQKRKISEARKASKMGPLPEAVKAKLSASISSLIWVTDGVANRRVPKDSIPEGWKPGRATAATP